jgi:hypothetical protein
MLRLYKPALIAYTPCNTVVSALALLPPCGRDKKIICI